MPFTKLPAALFDGPDTWQVLDKGRWLWSDHITLGEARAVLRLLRILASVSRAHGHKVLSLQDNAATAGSMAKGRSPAPALNCLLRRRASMTLAADIQLGLLWVETGKMPADEASREC